MVTVLFFPNKKQTKPAVLLRPLLLHTEVNPKGSKVNNQMQSNIASLGYTNRREKEGEETD